MNPLKLSRHQVSRYTRAAQVLFVVFAVGVAAVLIYGPLKVHIPTVAQMTAPEPQPLVLKTGRSSGPPIDPAGTAVRLALFSNSPKPLPPPPVVDTTPTAEVKPAASPEDLKYLGPVQFGATRMALITRSGKQRVVGVGDALENEKITEITTDAVTLQDKSSERSRSIDRAQSAGDVLTRVSGLAAPRMAVSGVKKFTPVAAPPTARVTIPNPESTDKQSRLDRFRSELKATGRFSNEEELNAAARERLEQSFREPGKEEKVDK